jgi:outer membrane beta-barrel protein
MFLTTAERQVTTDLGNKDVQTKSFVTPKSYIGADFKWVPIYGKMAWRNRKITPFDLYFSIGGGTTSTNQGTSEPTFHLGTGQIFALSKSTAFRWDFSWHAFQSKAGSGTTQSSSNFNNLFITVGMSFFFPEATYR